MSRASGPQEVERAAALRSLRSRLFLIAAGLGVLSVAGVVFPGRSVREGEPVLASAISVRPTRRAVPPVEEDVWRILLPSAMGTSPDVNELARRIHELGDGALPVVVGILCGDLIDPDEVEPMEGSAPLERDIHPRALELQREALLLALARWPVEDRVQALIKKGKSSELDQKLVVVGLLGEIGQAQALPGMFEVLSKVEPVNFRRPYIQVPIVGALKRILRSDAHSFTALEKELPKAPAELLPVVVSALGEVGSQRGLVMLPGLAGRDRALDLELIESVGEIAETTTRELPFEMADLLRSVLVADDRELARAAAVGLAKMNDQESISLFIFMLTDEDQTKAYAAHWSLKHMSGMDLPAEPGPWNEWYDREYAWYLDEAPALYEALGSEDLAEVGGALARLAAHRLYRHDSAERIGPMLSSPNPAKVRAAATALDRLGSRRAVPWLVDALDLAEEDSQRLALVTVLQSLTGLSLPAERAAWIAGLPD